MLGLRRLISTFLTFLVRSAECARIPGWSPKAGVSNRANRRLAVAGVDRPARSRPLLRRAADARRGRPRGARARRARPRRPLRLRQVDPAGADLRPARAERRRRSRSAARPTAGERLARCAFMPQRDLLLPWYSAIDNAALALRNQRMRPAPRRARAAAGALRALRPGRLRGGARRPSSPAGCASGSPSCAP